MKCSRHGRLDENDLMNNVSYNVNTDVVTTNNHYITLQNNCQSAATRHSLQCSFMQYFFQLIYLVTCSFSEWDQVITVPKCIMPKPPVNVNYILVIT